jgi:2-dehydro-3-deoxygluconokinase
LIAVGETMAMLTPSSPEPLATAMELRLDVGGAESNVACHAAALGVRSAWVSALGDDALGDRVRNTVAARGVKVDWVRTDPEAPTGVYFKDPGRGVLYYRRGSAASRMGVDLVTDVPIEQAEVVHISGITPALSPRCATLIDAIVARVRSSTTLLSLDINYRAGLWPTNVAGPVLHSLAQSADIVFVGLDEARTIWGCMTPDDTRALLNGTPRLVVKDGAADATEFKRMDGLDTRTTVAAIPTDVIEPVGAGDAFAAGYLAALLNGADAAGRLSSGHWRAHLVLQSMSDFADESPTEGR